MVISCDYIEPGVVSKSFSTLSMDTLTSIIGYLLINNCVLYIVYCIYNYISVAILLSNIHNTIQIYSLL